jgi:hypothetical protein
MTTTPPDVDRALDLARALCRATETKAPSAPWTDEERVLVAEALLAVAKDAKRARAKALNDAARLLEGLADREVMQPALVGTYTGLAADIRALRSDISP